MKIGIDIDGTINDLHSYILLYGLKNDIRISGNGIKNKDAYKIKDIFDWDEKECIKFKKYFQHEILNIVKPREDASVNILKLKEGGHKVYIITGRKINEMNNTYVETKQWLLKNNIKFDKLILEENDKGIACLKNKIDIYIDDSPKHLEKVKRIGNTKLYIFDNVYNKDINDVKYERIYSFDDLYNKINNL